MYTLPNRKAFADSITRLFRQYRKPLDEEDEDVDLCTKRQGAFELLPYQKLVRDYLLAETPYRGLLVYHGLGSGKTCTAIAVAESLLSTRKIYVMAPKSLLKNFESQISECGDPIYRKSQFWESKAIGSAEDRAFAKGLGISDAFLDKNGRFFTTVPGRPSNFDTLDTKTQKEILSQIEDVIKQRFTFIAYNGITKDNIDRLFPEETMFNDSVVIIDEAHNLIGMVEGESILKTRVYNMIYNAKNAKVVCMSGTPVINRPTEVAYLMNLLRGPIERVVIPTKEVVSWDEGLMTTFFRKLPDVDIIEQDSVKRHILLTRNPPYFESQYNEKGERIAVKYNKDLEQEPDIVKWVESWRSEFQKANGNVQLVEPENITKEELQCLPTNPEEFINTFLDGLSIKNALMFQRRVQGLVSYYKGADERLLAKRVDEAETLVKVEMSPMQFNRQLEARWKEIQQESRKGRVKSNLEENFSSYRAVSRMVCNYAVPKEYKDTVKDVQDENEEVDGELPILDQLRNKASQYLSLEGLKEQSPKMLKIYETLKASVGEAPYRKQLVYSNQERLEGVGLFGAILDNNGFQRQKIIKQNGVWIEDPDLKPGVPAQAMFTGKVDESERDLIRQIFNQREEQNFPPSLKDSIKEPGRLCVFMITKAGAEGINLMNVRHVHIMESHWNPALIDQAIGRAIRLCSHATLPMDQRTVKVNQYMTVFNKDQLTTAEGNNIIPIRRQDMVLKRQEGEQPVSVFMSSDEFLQEIAYEKGRVSKNISHLLKQAAIDCEIHRKLHAKEKPIIQCMRFDTTVGPEDLAFLPTFKRDERDVQQLRNITRRKRRIQKVVIKQEVMLLDPDTNEIFDAIAFEDNNRLLRIGTRTGPGEIRFFT